MVVRLQKFDFMRETNHVTLIVWHIFQMTCNIASTWGLESWPVNMEFISWIPSNKISERNRFTCHHYIHLCQEMFRHSDWHDPFTSCNPSSTYLQMTHSNMGINLPVNGIRLIPVSTKRLSLSFHLRKWSTVRSNGVFCVLHCSLDSADIQWPK